jgi:hypothetical protein
MLITMNNYTINKYSFGTHPYEFRTTVSFIASSFEQFYRELIKAGSCIYQADKIDGLEWSDFLKNSDGQPNAAVIMSTQSKWIAFAENGRLRGIPTSLLCSMATRLRTQCVGFTYDDLALAKSQDRPFGLVLEYYDGTLSEVRERTIYLCYDGGKWDFSQNGDPLPFENIDFYTAKKKRDRFTKEILFSYALQLGIRLDNPQEFYLPQNTIGLTWQYSKSDNKMDKIAQQIANEFGMKLTILKPNK